MVPKMSLFPWQHALGCLVSFKPLGLGQNQPGALRMGCLLARQEVSSENQQDVQTVQETLIKTLR